MVLECQNPDFAHFNPLHREGGDDGKVYEVEKAITGFQSTPPRGWRRYKVLDDEELYQISIHSTARVETGWSMA